MAGRKGTSLAATKNNQRIERAREDVALASTSFLFGQLKEHFGKKLDGVDLAKNPQGAREACRAILYALEEKLGERIRGQPEMIHIPLMSLVLGEHVLLEGLPGVGKTEIVKWLAHVTGLPFKRVQFIPDMLPSDLVGKNRIDPAKLQQMKEDAVKWVSGPLFTSVLLADEINRAPSKVQAALLEAMGENQITPLGQVSRVVASPIHRAALNLWWQRHKKDGGLLGLPTIPPGRKDLVQFTAFATMNPIEQEGTYPLSEAQVDRFAFKVNVPYPPESSYHDIAAVVFGGGKPPEAMEPELEEEDYTLLFENDFEAMEAVLAPVYFLLLCRSFLLPQIIEEQKYVHDIPMFDPRKTLRELGMGVERVYRIALLTNVKTPAEEGLLGREGIYAQPEQVDIRRFLNRPEGKEYKKLLSSRHCKFVQAGASPRGFLKLLPASLCQAFLAGRDQIEDEDIRSVVHSVLRHRIHMDVHARLEGISPTEVIDTVADCVLKG